MGQYWLGKKAQTSFQMDLKRFQKITNRILNIFIYSDISYWLTAWLMPSDQHNSATSLIFSLFDIALAREVPFGMPQYIEYILHGLTSVLLCVPFIFVNSDLVVVRDGFLCVMAYFHSGYLDLQRCFLNRPWSILLCNELNTADFTFKLI